MADPLSNVADALLRQPSFDRAARHYVDHIIKWRRDLGLYNRIGTEIGQHVVYYVALLHFAQTPCRPEDGATFTNILRICERRGNCGSRALRTILGVLQLAGLINAKQGDADGRVQVFAPSERLTETLREHLKQTLTCLDLVLGVEQYARRIEEDRSFVATLLARSGRPYVDLNLQVVEAVEDLSALIKLRGGCPTVFRLVHADINGLPPPSPQAVAREFKLSTSQVRNVIKAAEGAGLVSRRPDGTLDTRHLASRQRLMLARELALHAKYGLQIDADVGKASMC